jgi:predicted acyl esterase
LLCCYDLETEAIARLHEVEEILNPSALQEKTTGTTAQSEDSKQSQRLQKPVRRNERSRKIDDALLQIADSRPKTHDLVFQSLDRRRVPTPLAEPFVTGGGWIAGFRRDAQAARAWLSKRWSELDLLPFPRGPKKAKK